MLALPDAYEFVIPYLRCDSDRLAITPSLNSTVAFGARAPPQVSLL
jgi:hypothetical protein